MYVIEKILGRFGEYCYSIWGNDNYKYQKIKRLNCYRHKGPIQSINPWNFQAMGLNRSMQERSKLKNATPPIKKAQTIPLWVLKRIWHRLDAQCEDGHLQQDLHSWCLLLQLRALSQLLVPWLNKTGVQRMMSLKTKRINKQLINRGKGYSFISSSRRSRINQKEGFM